MSTDGTKTSELSAKQHLAAIAIAAGANHAQTCETAGCSPRTLCRWKKIPEFQRAVIDARWDIYDQSVGATVAATAAALETLREVCTNRDAPETARVSAASRILSHSQSSFESYQLKKAVSELEEVLKQDEQLQRATK